MNKILYIVPVIVVAIIAGAYIAFIYKPPSVQDPGVIGPNGGRISSSDGNVFVKLPEGALTEATKFTITPAGNYSAEGVIPGTIYQFTPSVVFNKPVELTLRYSEAMLNSSMREDSLVISKWNGTSWVADPSSVAHPDSNTVTANVTSFSIYSIEGAYMKVTPAKAEVSPGGNALFYMNYGGYIREALQSYSKITATATQGAFYYTDGHRFEGVEESVFKFLPEALIYKASIDAPGGMDTIRFEYRLKDEYAKVPLSVEMEINVTVSIDETYTRFKIEPYPNKYVKPGQRTIFSMVKIDPIPEGTRVYEWNCTSVYGALEGEPNEHNIWYRANADAPDGTSDTITLTLWVMQGENKVFVGRASTKTETYNPTTVYSLCNATGGLLGNIGEWYASIVDHEWHVYTTGFKARVGDQIRITIYRVEFPRDIYLRVGTPDDPGGDPVLLIPESLCKAGYDGTFTIGIG